MSSIQQLPGLPAPDVRGAVVLISGWRGVGKTTLLLALRTAALETGQRVGGFLSVARFADGAKSGIDLMDAASGATVPLATYRDDTSDVGNAVHTRHYVFYPAALVAGAQYAAAGQGADVLFVDELGPLELERGEGWADVIPLVAARQYGVALVVVRPELVDVARERLGLPPLSPVIVTTGDNRDDLREALAAWIGGRKISGQSE